MEITRANIGKRNPRLPAIAKGNLWMCSRTYYEDGNDQICATIRGGGNKVYRVKLTFAEVERMYNLMKREKQPDDYPVVWDDERKPNEQVNT